MAAVKEQCKWRFQAMPEQFFDYVGAAENEPAFRASTLPLLGLIDRPYGTTFDHRDDHRQPWERLQAHVKHLNEQCSTGTCYKVIYVTRHGLGYHNVFEAQVGREAWNSKWSHLDGDDKITWADSQLNDEGIQQARSLGRFWHSATSDNAMPLPQSIYTSPLARCLETTKFVFEETVLEHARTFQPIVKEALRERITDHTCDRRSSRDWIVQHYPTYSLEAGFLDEDPLWTGGHWESAAEHQEREQQLLEDIFENDPNEFVSFTTHSYTISAILGALGLKQFRVGEGTSIALLVKGQRVG